MKKEKKDAYITEQREKELETLSDLGKYDEIFEKYGQNIFNLYVPKKYKRKDIKKLFEEGKFEDIYTKYGAATYNKYINLFEQAEVLYETGSGIKSVFNRLKNIWLRRILPSTVATAFLFPVTISFSVDAGKAINSIRFAKQIKEYNNKINNYAEEVKSMNLTDSQIFIKLMKDMWDSIDGYAHPKNEAIGFYRLTLENEEIGVCRNFADDMTAKLNLINPNYNARNLTVYMDDNKNYKIAKITRHVVENNEIVEDRTGEDNNTQNNNTEIDFNLLDYIPNSLLGNHMVTAVDVDVKGNKLTLILDPTNPSIGVFKDGKIFLFSTPDGEGFETRKLHQFAFDGLNGTIEVAKTEATSFLPCEYSLEELEKLYGIEALNKDLEFIEKIEQKNEKNHL